VSDINLQIKNFPAQQTVFDSTARYKIVVKGRRFGLTKGAANDFIKCALNKSFKQGLWIDTVNSNIERYVERYFLPHLKNLPQDLWSWRKQLKILEINGSYIDFRSSDRPENIEGFGYDKLFINEAGIVLKDEYLWNNAVRPMLWDYAPSSVIGGTPKGKGVFYQLAEQGKDPEQSEYEYFHFTSFDNPYLNLDALKKDMADMPENVVKQEIYADFIDDSGVVFRNILSVATAVPHKPIDEHTYVMGVDLAKTQDFTVITVYDRKTNAQVYQDRFRNVEWPMQKKRIKAVSDLYHRALVVIDATGLGDPIADDLTRAGVPIQAFKLTNQSKKELIEKMVIWTEQGKCTLLNIPESVQEFNNFTYDVSSSGRIRYEAPVGFHDDIVIAHCLAIWSLNPLYREEVTKPKTALQEAYERQKEDYIETSESESDIDEY